MSDRFDKLREEYEGEGIDDSAFDSPHAMFKAWFEAASGAEIPMANGMALATATQRGIPSVRIVLLKNIDEQYRLWFYTDYGSQKGRELDSNGNAEVLFYWQPLHRQVRIAGQVARLDTASSDAYFLSRPRASSLSAMASQQSEPLGDDGLVGLERRRRDLEQEFGGRPLIRPERWGGYALSPLRYEFWQGRPDRLHHRLIFELKDTSSSPNDVANMWKRRWVGP